MSWEVMTLTAESYSILIRLSNEAGQNGWELVSVVPAILVGDPSPETQPILWFKRRVKS